MKQNCKINAEKLISETCVQVLLCRVLALALG